MSHSITVERRLASASTRRHSWRAARSFRAPACNFCCCSTKPCIYLASLLWLGSASRFHPLRVRVRGALSSSRLLSSSSSSSRDDVTRSTCCYYILLLLISLLLPSSSSCVPLGTLLPPLRPFHRRRPPTRAARRPRSRLRSRRRCGPSPLSDRSIDPHPPAAGRTVQATLHAVLHHQYSSVDRRGRRLRYIYVRATVALIVLQSHVMAACACSAQSKILHSQCSSCVLPVHLLISCALLSLGVSSSCFLLLPVRSPSPTNFSPTQIIGFIH